MKLNFGRQDHLILQIGSKQENENNSSDVTPSGDKNSSFKELSQSE